MDALEAVFFCVRPRRTLGWHAQEGPAGAPGAPPARVIDTRLGDFGLSKVYEQLGPREGTGARANTALPFGTLGYMAPEVFRGVPVVTVKADVYSLGVVILQVRQWCCFRPPPPLVE